MKNPVVKFHTNLGAITLELDIEKAPITVKNFLDYVRNGFYDFTIFHRVIRKFMIQGGGFNAEMTEKDTKDPIENESKNGLKNVKYSLAMARRMGAHSATSQFFINTVDNHFLDFKDETGSGWGYCVFGKVIEGTEVVDAIEKVETVRHNLHDDVPKTDIIIEKVEEIL